MAAPDGGAVMTLGTILLAVLGVAAVLVGLAWARFAIEGDHRRRPLFRYYAVIDTAAVAVLAALLGGLSVLVYRWPNLAGVLLTLAAGVPVVLGVIAVRERYRTIYAQRHAALTEEAS